MDRKLICGALVLLTIQITLLVADVDFYPGASEQDRGVAPKDIGVISKKKENVKRRSQGSVVWEDSQSADHLKNFDSILTLENSSAQIKLENDIKIDLQENTLIVLEPQESNAEESLRIRFSRGHLLSQSGLKKMQLASEQWEISAQPGASLSLKGLNEQQLEIEVTSGTATVNNQNDPKKIKEISSGSRLTLSKTEVLKDDKISQSLKVLLKDEERIYTHIFPINYIIRWEGHAEKLRVIDSDRKIVYHELSSQQQNQAMSFTKGTHYLSLENSSGVSKEVILRVIEAPKIRYTSPLPRERFLSASEILFSWLPLDGAVNYSLELTNENGERLLIPFEKETVLSKCTVEGTVQMRVFGQDELGFRMPPHYSQTIFILQDALAPPQLRAPANSDIRAPADSKIQAPAGPQKKPLEKNDDSAFNWRWYNLFIKRAYAEENITPVAPITTPAAAATSTGPAASTVTTLPTTSGNTTNENKKTYVTFSWFPVPGADFYNIEISSQEDFQNPEVIAKAHKELYTWSDFKPRIYFWRVAAGSNSGRMGLFSEVAKLDLTDIAQKSTGEISPGVKLFTPKEIILKPVVPTTREEPKNSILDINKSPIGNNGSPVDVKVIEIKPPHRWTSYANLNLHYLNYSLEKNFNAALAGFANTSITGGTTMTKYNEDKYLFKFSYTQAKWTPENKSALPFQDELTTSSYSFSALYQKSGRDLSMGLQLESQPLLRRIALEQLTKEEVFLLGPAMSYNTIIADNIDLQSIGAILYGESVLAAAGENTINYQFKTIGWQPYLGGDFNFKLFFGPDSLSGFNLTTGIHLGVKW